MCSQQSALARKWCNPGMQRVVRIMQLIIGAVPSRNSSKDKGDSQRKSHLISSKLLCVPHGRGKTQLGQSGGRSTLRMDLNKKWRPAWCLYQDEGEGILKQEKRSERILLKRRCYWLLSNLSFPVLYLFFFLYSAIPRILCQHKQWLMEWRIDSKGWLRASWRDSYRLRSIFPRSMPVWSAGLLLWCLWGGGNGRADRLISAFLAAVPKWLAIIFFWDIV